MNRIMKQASANVGIKRQRGFGLLELGLVLLIVSVLGIYAYQQYQSNRDESQAQSEVADITSYFAKTQERYSNQQDYSNLTTAALIQANVFPASMTLVPNVSVQNKFQGQVTAATATLNTANDAVAFSVQGYTSVGCSSVIPKVASAARTISVGGAVVKPDGGRLNITTLGAQCSATPVGTVVYTIGK